MQKGVSVINAIGSITFLLLTLVIYLAIKGRLGTYIALATTANNQTEQGKSTVETGPNAATIKGSVGSGWKTFTPSLKPIPPAQTSTGYPFLKQPTPSFPTIPGFPG